MNGWRGTSLIILDTNAARLDLTGAEADLLRVIVAVGRERVAVPWMVLEELAAQRAIHHREAWQEAVSAVEKLKKHRPWTDVKAAIGEEDGETAREHWRQEYSSLFEIIPTSDAALRQALVREANRLKPAKDSTKKEGARDVAIWLSVVEYARENPEEKIFFVTANKKDFGDGTSWPPPMDQDIAGMEDRITLLSELGEVISTFTEPVPNVSQEAVDRALRQDFMANFMGHAAKALHTAASGQPTWFGSGLPRTEDPGSLASRGPAPTENYAWVTEPKATPIRVEEVTGHKIGDSIWFIAEVDWVLAGWTAVARRRGTGFTRARTWCNWQTRVLVAESHQRATLMASDRPVPLTLDALAQSDAFVGEFEVESAFPEVSPGDFEEATRHLVPPQPAGTDLERAIAHLLMARSESDLRGRDLGGLVQSSPDVATLVDFLRRHRRDHAPEQAPEKDV